MRIWIDATRHDDSITIFGMTLLERTLRTLVVSQAQLQGLKALEKQLNGLEEAQTWLQDHIARRLEPSEVRVELAPGGVIPADLPQDLLAKLPIVFAQGQATVRDRLAEALRDADGEPLLALSADTEIDVRTIEHVVRASQPIGFIGGTGSERGAVLRIDGPLPEPSPDEADDLVAIAESCLTAGVVKDLSPDEFDGYIRKLRRTTPPWIFRVRSRAEASRVERFLFGSNYKGATDFLTRYAFPPLVWRMVGPLAERRVQPNVVTAVGMVCCFAAIPLFAAGWWLPGLLLAYAMAVLDSVDGKLARVTFSSSEIGNLLDHGTDLVHPPFWYFAWAWGLSAGDPASGVFQASLWMAGLYVGDRILETLFKRRTGGRSVQDYTPLDTKLRTFVSRRNVNLALFTAALPLGLGLEAFYAIVGLQLATAGYHLVRLVQFWDVKERKEARSPIAASAPFLEPAR